VLVCALLAAGLARGAARGSAPLVDVVVATDRQGATITRADGSAVEGLAWLLPGDRDVALSPDGRLVAFSSARDGNREIYVGDAVTGGLSRLTRSPGRDDATPAWSPNGRRLAWASGTATSHDLWAMRADGSGKTPVVRTAGDDVEPSWGPGGRVVFASNADGRFRLWTVGVGLDDPAPLGELPGGARRPAWHPAGDRIAYTGVASGNADVWAVTADGLTAERLASGPGFEGRPSWARDGRSLAFVRGRGRLAAWSARADGTGQRRLPLDVDVEAVLLAGARAELAPRADALLPDLDQRPPADLVLRIERGRELLGFASAVDNVGRGPLRIRGTRPPGRSTMRADQLVELRGGGVVVRRDVGRLRYETHPPHRHWHLQPFDRYELRALDGALLRTDRKTGFCLLDRWGLAPLPPGRVRPAPRFLGSCAARSPGARSVEQGSSVGYTDRYPGFFHGQDVDVTTLPAGLYVLVHRANPERRLRELTYANNVAAVLVRLRRTAGAPAPTVEVLRACDRTDRCAPRGL
jgi:hypothetical protein